MGATLGGLEARGLVDYGGHTQGWTNPAVLGLLAGGVALLAAFAVIESRVAEPMFQLSLFRIRAFTAGDVAGFAVSIARGGLQFMLIIWLQGIWLPLHGTPARLISGPFHHGLVVVFAVAAALAVLAALASLLRGGRPTPVAGQNTDITWSSPPMR
jgi:hypothetical protein